MNTCKTLALPMILLAASVFAASASAAPVTYRIDPTHTYPNFAADHMGLSVWRGKFDHSTGTITLDRAAGTGSLHIVTEVSSINFGYPPLKKMVLREALPPSLCKSQCAFFDAEKYPTAVYDGRPTAFAHGVPTRVVGQLTLHGVTRPLDLGIDSFKCIPDPIAAPRERCGAEASGTFNRAAFDVNAGQSMGFDMKVTLAIQVEAVETE
ncbi:MAG: YceI family protein [Gammaproteobacteria bacterium]